MPKDLNGKIRPSYVFDDAVKVVSVASSEDADAIRDDGKDSAAKALGKKGGIARAKKLTAKRRSEIASKAAMSRWNNVKKEE